MRACKSVADMPKAKNALLTDDPLLHSCPKYEDCDITILCG